jgi:hypothetical protein
MMYVLSEYVYKEKEGEEERESRSFNWIYSGLHIKHYNTKTKIYSIMASPHLAKRNEYFAGVITKPSSLKSYSQGACH